MQTMKKILFVILVALGLIISAQAGPTKQCMISGTNDGSSATVELEGYNESSKEVTVGFYNDSDKVVTIIATVLAEKMGNNIQVTAIVQPRSSMSKIVAWPHHSKPGRIEIQSAKCQPK